MLSAVVRLHGSHFPWVGEGASTQPTENAIWENQEAQNGKEIKARTGKENVVEIKGIPGSSIPVITTIIVHSIW